MERKWLNLTPHSITIVNGDGEIVKEIPSSGNLRLSTQRGLIRNLEKIPIIREELRSPVLEGLPEEELEGAYVIVSSLVASSSEAVKWLLGKGVKAVLVPTDFVRDGDGRIIGAKALKLIEGLIPCPYCGHGVKKECIELEDKPSFFCIHCGTEMDATY